LKVIALLEKLLHEHIKYLGGKEFHEALDILKENLVIVLIMVFPNWTKIFYIHVGASSIALSSMFTQPDEGNIDHLVYFSNQELQDSESNYTTMGHEDLAMVYALQNF